MAEDQDKKPAGGEENDEFQFPSEDFQTSSDPDQRDVGSDFGSLGAGQEEEDDLGNLPPLSDFESSDSTPNVDEEFGGLPPLSDIQVETPVPGKSGKTEQPTTIDSGGAFDTPASDSDLDTPMPGDLETPQGAKGEGSAFQDLAADSDFSPETPEIGPGPDTDLETPMFDSAFGGGPDDFGSGGSPTDTPTQAMETPMFGESSSSSGGGGDDFGFDDNAFGAAPGGDFGATPGGQSTPPVGGGFDAGTPVPDFSPDTGVPGATPPPTPGPGKGKKVKAAGGKGKGASPVVIAIAAVIALIVGVVGGQFLSNTLTFLPNPLRAENANLQTQLDAANKKVADAYRVNTGPNKNITQSDIDELTKKKVDLAGEIQKLQDQEATAQQNAQQAQDQLTKVQADLDNVNSTYVDARNKYDQLQNEMSILHAQQDGLMAEIDRYQGLVGKLDDANTRRTMTKDTLLNAVDRLEVQIKEGSPLTPAKYNQEERVKRVEALRNKLQDAKWVSPQLLDEYTSLYLDEMKIAKSREYFFAKIPVKNRIGVLEEKWAECLMNGDWSVYFRTLDGKQVGIYQNVSETGTPNYQFRQFLDASVEKEVESEVTAARPADFEDKVAVIAQKQVASDGVTPLQRAYNSL